jgi:hypothetical protein
MIAIETQTEAKKSNRYDIEGNLDLMIRPRQLIVTNVLRKQMDGAGALSRRPRLQTHLACSRMKRVEAKIVENELEDPRTEPDQEPDTWLIQGKLSEDVLDWENVRLDFQSSEIEAEIIESSLSDPTRFTVRTSGRSPLKKGNLVHVDIR